ncbi:PTS ascorbate transporter subunit IIC [Amphibacillus sp. Q70]|uniref:PTS ascorbate transporter subunit IIC n=1 Tax=Amphibacillus sp. Q70 TaxID=3453416 RepID=UPI003F8730EA
MIVIDLFLEFVTQLLSTPTILIGLIALIGLLIQKKPMTDVITGTIKTIMGFLLISAGAGVVINSITPLNDLLSETFNFSGVLPVNESAFAAASNEFGTALSGIMAIAMIANIVLARFSKFKYIYLTGHEVMWVSTVCAIVLGALNTPMWMVIIMGGLITGLYMAVGPVLIYKSVCKVTGTKDLAVGHSGIVFYWISIMIAKLTGNKEKSAEDINVPKSLNFLRDLSVSLSLAMLVVYLIVSISAIIIAPDVASEIFGGVNLTVFSITHSIEFAASIYIIQAGVRMVVAELIPAFQGVANKFIPNAVPALDIPILYPYQPNSTLIGFICASIGAVVAFFIQVSLIGTPFELPIIIPTLFTAFFFGATYGCLGNVEGGLRGTIIGSFVTSIVSSMTPALLIKFGGVLITGTTFGGSDSAVIGIFLNQVGDILPSLVLLAFVIVMFMLPIVHGVLTRGKPGLTERGTEND